VLDVATTLSLNKIKGAGFGYVFLALGKHAETLPLIPA
jgi:hypothetical protein